MGRVLLCEWWECRDEADMSLAVSHGENFEFGVPIRFGTAEAARKSTASCLTGKVRAVHVRRYRVTR